MHKIKQLTLLFLCLYDSDTPKNHGRYGINLLADEVTTASGRSDYLLCVNIPDGMKLKVIIKEGTRTDKSLNCTPESWTQNFWSAVQFDDGYRGRFYISTQDNWMARSFDKEIGGNILTSIENGRSRDLKIMLCEEYDITLEYYENGATEPSKVKQVKMEDQATSRRPDFYQKLLFINEKGSFSWHPLSFFYYFCKVFTKK